MIFLYCFFHFFFRGGLKFLRYDNFVKDKNFINGLTEYKLYLKENFKPSEITMLELIPTSDGGTRLNFTNQFRPGCIVAVKYVLFFVFCTLILLLKHFSLFFYL